MTSTDDTLARYALTPEPSTVVARSKFALTASASNGVPSENVTPSRRVISNVRSSTNAHSVARPGSSSASGVWWMRRSYTGAR